jgi:hypothetical protein
MSVGGKALVFISHDSRDAGLAEAFGNLLSDVSAGTLKSFRSSDKKGSSGIEFGTEWYKAIMSQLGDATDVVALLTHHSIDRPWILYEAGVAKGKLDTNVLGIALGVPLEKVSTGPFGQFQNCSDDEDWWTGLVIQLLRRNPDASPREEAVRMQVKVFLGNVKSLLPASQKQATQQATDETGIAKLFEEVKAMVRELPERVDDRVRSVARRGPMRRMRRFHPMMLEELLFRPPLDSNADGFGIGWLLFISLLKDDLPWLYELGIELYRALRDRDQRGIVQARRAMLDSLKLMSRSDILLDVIRPDDEESYLMFRHLPEMLERFLDHPTFDVKIRRRRLTLEEPDEIKSA